MKKPNIVLLFPDQHRGDWLPYSKDVFASMGIDEPLNIRMPNIKKLMDNGTTFINTITPSPVCAPARACLASGLKYERCGVINNSADYNKNIKTFYSALKDNGYSVGGAGKFDLHKGTMEWGLNGWVPLLEEIGFTEGIDNAGKLDAAFSGRTEPHDPYMKLLHEHNLAQIHADDIINRHNKTHCTPIPDELYCDNWIGDNAVNLIRNFSREKPWFIQVNFAGPHDPWDITESMKKRWSNVAFPKPDNYKDNGDDIIGIRQNYAAMLENIDRICGDIIQEADNRGELENTYIIYASDHGEMLGDSNKYGKSVPGRASLHVPLVISGGDILKGKVNASLVELQDLASTILDLCGITDSFTPDSISLKPALCEGKDIGRTVQTSSLTPPRECNWKVIKSRRVKAVLYSGEIKEVYDTENDIWENDNLLLSDKDKAMKLISELLQEL